MADVTLTAVDGTALDVARGHLSWPLVGAWTAHLMLSDADTPPTGKASLTWLGTRMEGYVLRSGISEGQVSVLVSGGAGGLWKQVPAQHYDYQLALRLPLTGILSAVGERLSGTSTASILSTTMPSWIRQADEAGHLLDALADAVGAVWSVTPDGSVFFGQPAWMEADFIETRDFEPVSFDPALNIQELDPQTLGVVPGQTFNGKKVWTAEWSITPDRAGLRLWFLPDGGQLDDPLGLRALIKETMRGVDLFALYPGKVVQQRPNGTLDVVLDNKRFPGLTSVKYAVPVPAAKLSVDPGTRVLVAFEEGDLRRPRAQLWEPGNGGHPAARQDDPVGFLYVTTGNVGVAGATVVVNVSWSPTKVLPLPPNTVEYALKITGGSPNLSMP